MGIQLTARQQAQLRSKNFVLDEAPPGIDEQPTSVWYDPKTGKEFPNLPCDAWGITNYRAKGWRMGSAPQELKDEWAAGEIARHAELDRKEANMKKFMRKDKVLKQALAEEDREDEGMKTLLETVAALKAEVEALKKA